MRKLALAALAFVALTASANAQSFTMPPPAGVFVIGCVFQSSPPTLTNGQLGFAQCDSTGHLGTSGSGGGGGAFAPAGNYGTIVTTTTSSNASIPTNTGTVVVYNIGANDAYVALGTNNTVVATTGNDVVKSGQAVAFVVGANTFIAGITSTSTTTLTLSGGAGGFAGVGGSGAGGGSSSITTWAGGTLGAMANYGTSPGAVLVPGQNAFVTGAVNIAAASTALPSSLAAIGISDGGTGCSGGACLIAPTALQSSVAGSAPTVFIGVQGSQSALPVTVGGTSAAVSGSYCMASASGLMAAGLGSAAPIYSFRYGGAALAIVKNVWIAAQDNTTGFAAGTATFNLFAARSFSASDTGGTAATLTGNNGKLRTSFATTSVADIRISSTATLTAGTRTLDSQPLAALQQAVPTTVGFQLFGPYQPFFQAQNLAVQPLQLANNEGFVVQATVPATGTWNVNVTVCWDETTAY